MALARGCTFRPVKTGEHVSGTLIGSANLASGRYAMIDDGLGFTLVPWHEVLDERIGEHIAGSRKKPASSGLSGRSVGSGRDTPSAITRKLW
jgi:hypothetical protein